MSRRWVVALAVVALLVASPADANPNDLMFTMRFSARERRSHSEWRRELGADSRAAVQKFVQEVLGALQHGSK